ncbi:MAG: hypothetical protein KDK07_04320 [Bauldia sp.]|nr:hypothetical protein [Bauldia sp.]
MRNALTALLLLGTAELALAEDRQSGSFVDRIELWLELGRHERLLETLHGPDAVLAPFVSDGCSGGLSAGWEFAVSVLPEIGAHHGEHPPWEACCVAHDRLYHRGGAGAADAEASFADRLAADEAMRLCVIAEGERRKEGLMDDYGVRAATVELLYEGIAGAMYRAVRLGGVPCTRLPWRWGFGWPRCS